MGCWILFLGLIFIYDCSGRYCDYSYGSNWIGCEVGWF